MFLWFVLLTVVVFFPWNENLWIKNLWIKNLWIKNLGREGLTNQEIQTKMNSNYVAINKYLNDVNEMVQNL